jgi:hypothetical protein
MDGFKQFFSKNNQVGQVFRSPTFSATNGHSVQSLPQHGGVMRPIGTIFPVMQPSAPVQQSPPVQQSTDNFQQSQVSPATQWEKPKMDDKTMYLLVAGVVVVGYLLTKK